MFFVFISSQLFGELETSVSEVESTTTTTAQSFSVMQLIKNLGLEPTAVPHFLVNKVFVDDINKLLLLTDTSLWRDTRPPVALTNINLAPVEPSRTFSDFRRICTVTESLQYLYHSMNKLIERAAAAGAPLIWDKDDQDSLEFVVHAANIRASIFGVEMSSAFDIKEKAGNIIPAIAMTNSIVAALMVREANNLLCKSSKFKFCGCYNQTICVASANRAFEQYMFVRNPKYAGVS